MAKPSDTGDIQRRAQRIADLLDRCQLYGPADALRDEVRQLLIAVGGKPPAEKEQAS